MFEGMLVLVHWLTPARGPAGGPWYVGPETTLPLASVLAAVIGFVLLFWRLVRSSVRKTVRRLRGQPDPQAIAAVAALEPPGADGGAASPGSDAGPG
jgi:hypothetical protein